MEASAIKTFYQDNKIINQSDPADLQILEYAKYLDHHLMDYNRVGPYLQVGNVPSQGWVIYISVIKQQMKPIMEDILPVLIRFNVSFKIPENHHVHGLILDGGLGYYQIGKIISIYPSNDGAAVNIAKALIDQSKKYIGPDIPELNSLGQGIFAEFECHPYSLIDLKVKTKDKLKTKPWPFGSIVSPALEKSGKWLNRKYFRVQSLKNDAKGNVFKGLNFNKWSNIQWCIIKEGKRYQCTDDAGRDIKDRLLWQFKVQEELAGIVALPKPIDFFEANGNSYFVMDYIEGKSYNDLISEIQKGVVWYDLGVNEQTALVKLALQAVDIVTALHSRGFIHRDLSPVNFMVTTEGKMVAIDIELCYNIFQNSPNPVFTLGTAGYMSPAQLRCEIPTVEDDIFGLGNLLIRTFAGIAPLKYNNSTNDTLFDNINYFIRNRRLTSIICSCCDINPIHRPSINSISHTLELYLSQLITNNHLDLSEPKKKEKPDQINNLINKAIQSVFQFPQLAYSGKWYSKTKVEENVIANDFKSYSCYPEFYSGLAGIIYTLTIADQFGFDLGKNRSLYYDNFTAIHKYIEENSGTTNSGLYTGAGGVAVVMATMIKYGLLENNINQVNLIAGYLTHPNNSLNVINGLAGQGLAMIKCAELLDFQNLAKPAGELVDIIIREQNRDGSWTIKKDEHDKKGVKLTGFLSGISGIAYFLLIYGVKYYSERAKEAAIKSLGWLLKQRKMNNGHLSWPVNAINDAFDPWFEYGFTGVAFLFIKAYEVLGDPSYKDAAEISLRCHPTRITSNYITQASGIAGLGETYLEAYTVFGDDDWLDRANNIVSFLKHSFVNQEDEGIYWLDGSDDTPTADFMSGNSGIIHFLLRFQNLKRIDFPLISF